MSTVPDAADEPDIKLRMHYDSSGSWLEVPMLILHMMEMPVTVFSKYSYIDSSSMYLEEHLDAGRFLARFKFTYGRAPEVVAVDHGQTAFIIYELDKNIGGRDVILH
tara:strand:+ start:1958 stop:2278 length:321 start_codon:yes stop_codon:yes gene_type:complete